MPYELLDAIERAAIRDKQTPAGSPASHAGPFSRSTRAEQLGQWVERFFQLWCRNQWKRERYAPSFHVDDENLDPKTWCRFPILSGGYERELRQLRHPRSATTEAPQDSSPDSESRGSLIIDRHRLRMTARDLMPSTFTTLWVLAGVRRSCRSTDSAA